MENIGDLKTFLEQPRKVAIISHRNPDGDAIGSSLALFHYLSRHGHDATVAVPSDFPKILNFLPGREYVLIHDRQPETTDAMVNEADIIFCLDFNALHRIDKLGKVISQREVPKVLIDHHLDPEDFAEYVMTDTSASSTCELIYDFIKKLDDLQTIDKIIADCLFSGILTDTGSFKYSTSSKLYHIVAELRDKGVDDTDLQNKLFNSQTIKQIRLLGFCLTTGLELYPEFGTGLIVLTRDDYRRFKIKRGDTEGIVNHLLSMKAIRFGALISERDGFVKLSLRSKGDFSVQELASKHFSGGGHKNASGGISKDSLKVTVEKLKNLLPGFKSQLVENK